MSAGEAKPDFHETVQAATAGFLGRTFWLVSSVSTVPLSELAPHVPEHLAYVKELEVQGSVMLAGPILSASDAPTGEGLLIVRASSADEARAIVEQDPFHKRNLRNFTIRKWQCNVGCLPIKLFLSTQSLDLR
jgi:uncharacterized protein YciI